MPAEDLTKEPYSQLTPCNVCISPEEDPNSSQADLSPLAWYENLAAFILGEAGFDRSLMEQVEAQLDDAGVLATLSNSDSSFFGKNEIPELFAEDHIESLKAYFNGVRYPLLQENPYTEAMCSATMAGITNR